MQGKKIFIVVLLLFSAALFLLFIIPMRRTYHAKLVVNSDELITYRTIQDTSNWEKWYADLELAMPRPGSVEMQEGKKEKIFEYRLDDHSGYEKQGSVKVTKKDRWNMRIDWSEELVYKTNIVKKLHLLFNPSEYRAVFLNNLVQFKSSIEHPDNIFGGLTFEKITIPAGKLITLSDTVALSNVKERVEGLYDSLTAHIPAEIIKNPGSFLSQHETLNDSSAVVRVAVEVSSDVEDVKEPFDLLELDSHPAVSIQTQKGYTDIEEDITIMYNWLKKNDKRPATGYWIKHSPSEDIAKASAQNTLTIIQEVYSIK